MQDTFKVGDLVVLKSGGPVMTIQTVPDGTGISTLYRCQWFSGKKLESGTFPPESLSPAEARDK
jgi:uncharacterized protein YodC (DUF2158 family)